MHIKSTIVHHPSNCTMNFEFQGYYDLGIKLFSLGEIDHFIKCCQEKTSDKPTSYVFTHQLQLCIFEFMDLGYFGFRHEKMVKSFAPFQYFTRHILMDSAYLISLLSPSEIKVLIDISLPVVVYGKESLIQLVFET
jgi:hypothetical protein